MKTKEELDAIKEEMEALGKKLVELTEDELKQVTGGLYDMPGVNSDERFVLEFSTKDDGPGQYEFHFYHLK